MTAGGRQKADDGIQMTDVGWQKTEAFEWGIRDAE